MTCMRGKRLFLKETPRVVVKERIGGGKNSLGTKLAVGAIIQETRSITMRGTIIMAMRRSRGLANCRGLIFFWRSSLRTTVAPTARAKLVRAEKRVMTIAERPRMFRLPMKRENGFSTIKAKERIKRMRENK